MRITTNRTPGSVCALCNEPLELGTLGANFLPTSTTVRRAHVTCLRRWQRETLPYFSDKAK